MNTVYFAFIPVKYDATLTKVYSVKMKVVITRLHLQVSMTD